MERTEPMPNVFHATIKGLRGSWGNGLASLDVVQAGHAVVLHADSGPLIRGLDAAFGNVIQSGHRADISGVMGQPITYWLEDWGGLAGFVPGTVEAADIFGVEEVEDAEVS